MSQKQTFADWDIHYTTFSSTFLTPSIANSYALQRNAYSAVVNICVVDQQQQGQQVELSGSASNTQGQTLSLNFVEVREGEAIYYLAEFAIRDTGSFEFDICVKQQQRQHQLKFSETLYLEV